MAFNGYSNCVINVMTAIFELVNNATRRWGHNRNKYSPLRFDFNCYLDSFLGLAHPFHIT